MWDRESRGTGVKCQGGTTESSYYLRIPTPPPGRYDLRRCGDGTSMQSLPRLMLTRTWGNSPRSDWTPPRGSERFYSRWMFMIESRSEMKEAGLRGFEKKSAALSSVLTSRTEISPSST